MSLLLFLLRQKWRMRQGCLPGAAILFVKNSKDCHTKSIASSRDGDPEVLLNILFIISP